jgi:hypothetical protein
MGRDELEDIFGDLSQMLRKYQSKGKLEPKVDEEGNFDLWSFKDVEIMGRKRKEVFFASAVIRKSYVGFYYMPIYTDTDLAEVFEPELLATLKGKSCFHIRKLDPTMREQIEKALRVGYDLYEERGWV